MKKTISLTLILALFINLLSFTVYATASVPSGYTRIEAESFTQKVGATQVQDDVQASNGKLVGFMTADNDSFTLNYNSPISGATDAIIYGAIHRDAGTGDAHYQIIVNDGAAVNVIIPRSTLPTWSDYKAVPFTITLNEGANKIVVKRNGQYLPANIDCIDINSTLKNLALGKAVEVSSVWPGGESIVGGDKVTDGNKDTRWASAPNGTSALLTIDFGADVNFNTVMFVLYGDSPTMRVQAYTIFYYTNGQWTECYKNTVGVPGSSTQNVTNTFNNVTGSKLKIAFTKPESVDVSLYEVEVYKLAGGKIWDNNTLSIIKTSNNSIDFSWDVPKTNIFTNYVLLKDGSKVTDISTSDVSTSGNTVSYSLKNENLLLNKPTTGSNFWPTLPQSLATDGDLGTRWADVANSPSAWIEVDMLKEAAVDTFVLKEAFSPRITSFKIELYKNGTWTTAFDGTTVGDTKTVHFPATVGSKLRLSTVGDNATIYEIEAYNSAAFSNNGTFKLEAVDLLGTQTTNGPSAVFDVTNITEIKNIIGEINVAIPSQGQANFNYSATAVNSYGMIIDNGLVNWEITQLSGVSINGGILTVNSTANEGVITLKVTAQDKAEIFSQININVYKPTATGVNILGVSNLNIPSQAQYNGLLYDQYNNIITSNDLEFSLAQSVDGVSITKDGLLNVNANTQNQDITIICKDGVVQNNMTITLNTEQNLYKYFISDGGYSIINGTSYYNRPIYGNHLKDNGLNKLGVLGGDKPSALLTIIAGNGMYKRGHWFIGLENGKWFDSFEYIKSTYIPGRIEYELRDSSFNGTIKMTYIRPTAFEGLLVKITLPQNFNQKLVTAFGGMQTSQQLFNENDFSLIKFSPSNSERNNVLLSNNSFSLSGSDSASINSTSTAQFTYKKCDSDEFGSDINKFFQSEGGTRAMVGGVSQNVSGDVYFVITPDQLDNTNVTDFVANPANTFANCKEYYDDLTNLVAVDSPDEYLNLAMKAKLSALDGAWNSSCFMHGAMTWHFPMLGWKSAYGGVFAGWHDRIDKQADAFSKIQIQSPQILTLPPYAVGMNANGAAKGGLGFRLDEPNNFFYTGGENFVDIMLYDYEWTGDLTYIAKYHTMIKDFLQWEENVLGRPKDDMLFYENKVNEWNTDQKWSNGGYGTSATIFNYRANKLMVEISTKLGLDSTVFANRVQKIKKGIDEVLWQPQDGVYAEYVDVLGNKLAHNAPDLTTLSKAINEEYSDKFQAYQLIKYSEREIESISGTTPRNGMLMYSSNWLPNMWSTRGIYTPETGFYTLACYKAGFNQRADELLKGLEAGMHLGKAPGSSSANQAINGGEYNSTDFADSTSMFIRTTVEGLYGISMKANQGKVTITPTMPTDWQNASIKADGINYSYTYNSNIETFNIGTDKALNYILKVPSKCSDIKQVKVNDATYQYTIEAGVQNSYIVVEIPNATTAKVEVEYNISDLPTLSYNRNASGTLNITSSGQIKEIYDPQNALTGTLTNKNSNHFLAEFSSKKGPATFFALVEKGDISVWMPVDVEIKPLLSIENGNIVVENGSVYATFDVSNNSDAQIRSTADVKIARQSIRTALSINANAKQSLKIMINASHIVPGSNSIIINYLNTAYEGVLTNWDIAKQSEIAAKNAKYYDFVDLSQYYNQSLNQLHNNQYISPRPTTFSDTLLLNGRTGWEAIFGMVQDPVHVDTSILDSSQGTLNSVVPFNVKNSGNNSVFTSIYDNFPKQITIPVGKAAQNVYLLTVCSTNQNQSQLINAKVTVNLHNGDKKVLDIINPLNTDDWMSNNQSSPYALTPYVAQLGANTHGNVINIDLTKEMLIDSITIETVANEVLYGILGITLMNGSAMTAVNVTSALPLMLENVSVNDQYSIQNGTMAVKFDVLNTTALVQESKIVIATYDGTKLVNSVIENATIDKNGKITITKDINNSYQDAKVKIFALDSFETIKPVSKLVQISSDGILICK